ncbi:solute carrier family 4 member 11-like isoform X2 [Lineus longissimus]|uniref:solute carrier family 4 member 11-like isoform X2 n=1 Tax=Lineus longissimus TaxID=88925 RepID=UPI002B4EE246
MDQNNVQQTDESIHHHDEHGKTKDDQSNVHIKMNTLSPPSTSSKSQMTSVSLTDINSYMNRRFSQTLPQSFDASTYSINFPDAVIENDGDEVTLMYSKHEKIPMKDFSAEIRASMDVENFLNQAILMLDHYGCSLHDIIETMLTRLLTNEDGSHNEGLIEEAKEHIFTHDKVAVIAKTMQGTSTSYGGGFDYDQSWLVVLCSLPSVTKRHVAIARLKMPANFGRTSQEIKFIVLVIASTKEKGTKNALETGRTFATIFADMDFRLRLLDAHTEEEFKRLVWEHTKELAEEQRQLVRKRSIAGISPFEEENDGSDMCFFARGLRCDIMRRLPHYFSDFKDGIIGHRTISKLISTTMFLYFACLLPSIAFGMLNDHNTGGKIGVTQVIYSQTISGLLFGFCGGQPLIILLTTAPLALYTKIIFAISTDYGIDFLAMFTCTGLWNCFFLMIYALFDVSKLMKWSTRSTEEIFAIFISIAFSVDAIRDIYENFAKNYDSPVCDEVIPTVLSNMTNGTDDLTTEGVTTVMTVLNQTLETVNATLNGSLVTDGVTQCLRENSLLYLLLTLGTLWIGISLYNFTKTPFLNASKRELLADYSLPVAVLLMSFIASFVFQDIKLTPFNISTATFTFKLADMSSLTWGSVFACMGLGFPLSLLFFMDQNISSAMINNPSNKLKKGSAYHWDLFVVAILNAFLSLFGLPWVHAALPHSPLHVRALADLEDRVDQGHVYQIVVRVRETRLTAIFSHILIGLSLLMIPYPLVYIPRAVLDGLFLYVAYTALSNNELFERIMLLVTEQNAYPPNHYIRRVPQRKVHMFTLAQILQLGLLCAFGFAPIAYMKMVFPVLIMLLIPCRHKLIPRVIEKKFLKALDGSH